MKKLERLKLDLEGIESPFVLWWSGGLDSTLLLAVLRETGKPFDIAQSREMWSRAQKKRVDGLIQDWNLKVFSYAPSNIYFIGQEAEMSAVFEFAYAGGTLPLIKDLGTGDKCGLAQLEQIEKFRNAPMNWLTHVIGSRKDDVHYSAKQLVPASRWSVANMSFVAPLFDWARDEVIEALERLGLDTARTEDEDTGNLNLCFNCLKPCKKVFCPMENKVIPAVEWDRIGMLSEFRNKYGLN